MRLYPLWAWSVSLFGRRARFFAPARSALTPTRAVDVKAGRRSDLAKYTDIAGPCLDIHEHGGRLDAVGRQRAISGIGLAINSVRRPIGSSVFGLTLGSRDHPPDAPLSARPDCLKIAYQKQRLET